MKMKHLIICGSVLGMAACASTPKIDEANTTEPVSVAKIIPAPEPVAQPITAAPIESANMGGTALPYSGAIPGSAEDFVYSSGGDARVYFAYNEHDLSDSARNTLRQQASWLQLYPNVTAVVEGNADERGTREYNLALGARRADSVKAFLVAQGVAPSRLTTVSYGKERPIDAGSTDSAWSRNRNGHTNLMTGTIG